jgi:hypothetical protein
MSNDHIKTVHVVFKTHLDIGFTDYARSVTARYMNEYIPAAIDIARQMREEGGKERFLWTTGAWLIHEYLKLVSLAQRVAVMQHV